MRAGCHYAGRLGCIASLVTMMAGATPAAAARLGYWQLDETSGSAAVDVAAANDGIYRNGVTLGQPAGACDSGNSVAFDGSNDHVEIAHAPNYLLDDGTVAFWFRADTIRQTGLFSKDSSGYDTGGHLTIFLQSDGQIRVRLQSTSADNDIYSGTTVTAGGWHHIAFTFGAAGMELFVNGASVGTNGYTGGLGNTSGGSGNFEPIALGASSWTSGNLVITSLVMYLDGSMDEVEIHDTVLATAAIQSLAATCPASLASHWKLDETAGTTVVDATGGNDGTYRNGVTLAQPAGACGSGTFVDFDGSNDYAEIPHVTGYLVDDGTVAFWFKPDTIQQSGLFSKDSNGFDTGGHLTVLLLADGQIYVRLQSTTTSYYLYSGTAVTAGSWHHVAFNFGAGGMELFLDGVAVDTDGYTGGLGTTSGGSGNGEPIVLGANSWNSGNLTATPLSMPFDGSMDDVRFHDGALSAIEVQTLAGCGCPVKSVADDFPSVAYDQNAGTEPWTTDWEEINEADGPSAGIARVRSDACTSGNCLRLGRPSGTGAATYANRGVRREADLSNAQSPELSFVHRRGANQGSQTVVLSVSSDGGGSWTDLKSWVISSTDLSPTSESFSLTSHAAGNTQIRFLATGSNAELGMYIDDVKIGYTARDCQAGVDHFEILHDGAGIHCTPESVTVTAADAAGDPVTDYTGTIELDTGSGAGTWASEIGNQGSFSDPTPDDGLASYTFADADDGVATFGLTYLQGATPINVLVFQTNSPTTTDDDSEGGIAWSPSGFTVTANPLSNPPPNPINDPIPTQTSGTGFGLYLAAYGTTPTQPECGVIETYAGTETLKFGFIRDDPTTGTVAVTIDGNTIGTNPGLAAYQNVTFLSGRAQVLAKYKDVGAIRIRMWDDTVTEPAAGIIGVSNSFVVQPADFVISAIQRPDLSANPGVSVPTGTVFVAAGAPFRATVEARDSEGDLTPNYGNESSPEGIVLTAPTLVAPAGGRNGSNDDGAIGNGSAFTGVAPAGTFQASSVSWDEVGAITLRASVADGSYLGTGDVVGTESGTVGRFRPDHFDAATNAPTFATPCAVGGFGYVGQPFDYMVGGAPVLTVTAQAVANTTTQNYTGAWFRLTNGSLANRSYTAAAGTLDPSGLPAPGVDPVIVDGGAGVATLTFSAGTGLAFLRGLTPTAPFDSDVSLSIDVIDLDGAVHAANPARFGQAVAGAGISFDAGKAMRWGRLAFQNAHGSELVPLLVPLRAETWVAAGYFAPDTSDACTALSFGSLQMTPTPGTLVSTPTLANVPLAAGDAGLSLSPTGDGNAGTFDLQQDLSAAGDDLSWLRFDWDQDGSHDDDPTGRATFGVFSGDGSVIFQREVY